MAQEFLKKHGIDLNAEMAKIQFGDPTSAHDLIRKLDPHAQLSSPATRSGTKKSQDPPAASKLFKPINRIFNVSLPMTPAGSAWNIAISDGQIQSVTPCEQQDQEANQTQADDSRLNGHGALLTPSLCHPHVHLDKAFLLAHPKYAHLQIEEGTFSEAMELTGKAKSNFEHDDLLERGHRVVDESHSYGVTAMRTFVEVDAIVGMKCLKAGREIKETSERENKCTVQLCAFAQLPIFSGDDGGEEIRRLMRTSAEDEWQADVLGSTPYVESDREKMERNVEWMVDLALEKNKHLDFHLDYNLDPDTEPLVWHVLRTLKAKQWIAKTNKLIIGDLPVSFVGLPTSDLFMMRTDHGARGTLPVPKLIREYGLNAAISINNIGNAFTPQGSCDPLSVACTGVGVYQAGTKRDAEILYECVSTRAKAAIGLPGGNPKRTSDETMSSLEVKSGQAADLVLFAKAKADWHTRRSVSEAIYLYDGGVGRRTVKGGSQQ
ncbi:hypothetical protein H2203_008008 [Taxawa tesnikishii (nom. ined.)]|nr:hypothetical protein H2203_008008 [Dothideales sp. JES 119]